MNIPTVAEIQALQVQNLERESAEYNRAVKDLADEVTKHIVEWLKKSTRFPVNIPYIVNGWSLNVQSTMDKVFLLVINNLNKVDQRYTLAAAHQSYYDESKTKYNIIINIK